MLVDLIIYDMSDFDLMLGMIFLRDMGIIKERKSYSLLKDIWKAWSSVLLKQGKCWVKDVLDTWPMW